MSITDTHIKELSDKAKNYFKPLLGEQKHRIETVNPEDWSVSLFIGKGDVGERKLQSIVRRFFEDTGVDEDRWIYFGDLNRKDEYEWYFTHPDVPKDVIERMDADEIDEEQIEAEITTSPIEKTSLPKPSGSAKGDSCFLVLQGTFYREIEHGFKTVEYREIKPYYCDKFFGREQPLKKVKFQLGYSGKDGKTPEQMEFEVKEVTLVDDGLQSIPALLKSGKPIEEKDLPKGFHPTMYGIVLGKRLF